MSPKLAVGRKSGCESSLHPGSVHHYGFADGIESRPCRKKGPQRLANAAQTYIPVHLTHGLYRPTGWRFQLVPTCARNRNGGLRVLSLRPVPSSASKRRRRSPVSAFSSHVLFRISLQFAAGFWTVPMSATDGASSAADACRIRRGKHHTPSTHARPRTPHTPITQSLLCMSLILPPPLPTVPVPSSRA